MFGFIRHVFRELWELFKPFDLDRKLTEEQKMTFIKRAAKVVMGWREKEPRVIFSDELPNGSMLEEAKQSKLPLPWGYMSVSGIDLLDNCILCPNFEAANFPEFEGRDDYSISELMKGNTGHEDEKVRLVYLYRDDQDPTGSNDTVTIYPPMSRKCLV